MILLFVLLPVLLLLAVQCISIELEKIKNIVKLFCVVVVKLMFLKNKYCFLFNKRIIRCIRSDPAAAFMLQRL